MRIIKVHLQTLKSDSSDSAFAKLATTESDCSSVKRGGDLGPFTRGKMHPNFEAESWRLAVGAMSESPIETPSGYHIVRRLR